MSAVVQSAVTGDVDSPRPLLARDGRLTVEGWCLLPGDPLAPAVRLAAPTFILPATGRQPRSDVPRLFPTEAAARACGFVLTGPVPPGVHLARLEAQLPDGSWQPWRSLCIAAEEAPFATGIESPTGPGPVTRRVHVEGWALHPRSPVDSLTLRYGHQEIACIPGLRRTDLPASAARLGFKSAVILSAGRGALRVKAQLADGSAAVARTPLAIDVPTDENIGTEINLAAERIPLPRPAPAAPVAPPLRAEQPRNVLFVLYGSFDSNSALHVAALANELTVAGHACVVAVTHDLASLSHLPDPRFRAILHADAARGLTFPDGRGPDLIHAWTTRENVRRLVQPLHRRTGARVVVHLEDNEQELLALALGRPWADLVLLPEAELDRLVPDDLSHPLRSREFLAAADGVTVITDALREFAPAGRAIHTVCPAADARYFSPAPRPEAFRRLLDRRPGETFLCYHGNVHAANAAEVRELYAAVLQLNNAGQPVTLLRTGRDTVDFLGELAPCVAPHVIALGQILHHRHLPALMTLADIFVQPGWDDAFNRYRFPSKLPEFFALGRPVILPRSNLGTVARHGIDAYVLDRADAAGIVAAVTALRRDQDLCLRLADGAKAFAAQHFDWRRSAEALAKFYAGLAT